MSKCGFNKVGILLHIFGTPFPKNISGGLLLLMYCHRWFDLSSPKPLSRNSLWNQFQGYPDNCPRLELGFGSRSGSVLVLEATRQLPPRKIAPAARVRVWLGVSFGVGGQFFLGAIGLEPISRYSQEKRGPITRKWNLRFYQFWGIWTLRISLLNTIFW